MRPCRSAIAPASLRSLFAPRHVAHLLRVAEDEGEVALQDVPDAANHQSVDPKRTASGLPSDGGGVNVVFHIHRRSTNASSGQEELAPAPLPILRILRRSVPPW